LELLGVEKHLGSSGASEMPDVQGG
jgi:hypothetical protein